MIDAPWNNHRNDIRNEGNHANNHFSSFHKTLFDESSDMLEEIQFPPLTASNCPSVSSAPLSFASFKISLLDWEDLSLAVCS